MFLSAPSVRTPAQDSMCERLAELLASEGLVLEMLPRRDYPPSNALSEIARRLSRCAGVAVFGLPRHGSDSDASPAGITPWTHVEAGMAYGRGLPLLLLREPGVDTGAFDEAVKGHRTHVVDLADRMGEEALRAGWRRESSKCRARLNVIQEPIVEQMHRQGQIAAPRAAQNVS